VLKKQVERLRKAMGLTPMMATELEFFLFEKASTRCASQGLPRSGADQRLQRGLPHPPDHQGRGRDAADPQRLYAAGVPVENSKGEAETGQEELNIRYADALTGRRPSHARQATRSRKSPGQNGHSATFLAKWHHDKVGSRACHQSLWATKDARPSTIPGGEADGMSETMRPMWPAC
jgi:glutamine synthetase